MRNRTLSIVSATLLAAGLSGAAFAAQPAAPERSALQYQAVVLGNDVDFTGTAQLVQRPATGLVPGAYARYLIRNGETESVALARAAAIGDRPVRQTALPAAPELSGQALYEESVLGRSALSPTLATSVAVAPTR